MYSSAEATPKEVIPSTSYGRRLITPSLSLEKLLFAARAPISRSRASPPKTLLPPRAFTSVVESTTLPALATASMSALSSRGRVGSVNWTS